MEDKKFFHSVWAGDAGGAGKCLAVPSCAKQCRVSIIAILKYLIYKVFAF